MSKIAIVGVEGSGKSTLMAVFGEKFVKPDEHGLALDPADQGTMSTVSSLIAQLRRGRWPSATERSTVNELRWGLLRRIGEESQELCELTFLDYAGEVYRLAYGSHGEDETAPYERQIAALRRHVEEADGLIVLVNLSDVINGDLADPRVQEMVFQTGNIIKLAKADAARKREVALVFSQTDKYREVIEAAGGLEAVYAKYLPHIETRYPRLKLFSVAAVDRTAVDESGQEVPAKDFGSQGLVELLRWVAEVSGAHRVRTEDEMRQRMLTLRPAVHRVRFRWSIGSGIGVALVTVVALFLMFGTLVSIDSAGRRYGGAESYQSRAETALEEERRDEKLDSKSGGYLFERKGSAYLFKKQREEIEFAHWRESEARWAWLLTFVPILIGAGLLALTKFRTRRALWFFESEQWMVGRRMWFFVFGGDEWILYRRACCHLWGLGGVGKDLERAYKLFKRAAKRGNAEALCVLGWMPERGWGCEPSASAADFYHQEARTHHSMLESWMTPGLHLSDGQGFAPTADVTALAGNENAEHSPVRCCLRKENLLQYTALPVVGANVAETLTTIIFSLACGFFWGMIPLLVLAAWIAFCWVQGKLTTKLLQADALDPETAFGKKRFLTFLNDRSLNFAKGLAVLKGEAGQAADAERAADYLVQSAAVGNPEAYAVLAWMAATGRTKRYESMHLAWLVREAKARGSKLIERLEQPQDTDVVRLAL